MRQIYLVRHAQARYDPAVPDHVRPLTPTGHSQATALVEVLRELAIEEVHSSPYRRCLDTIGPFATHAGLALNEVADLRERAFTDAKVDDWDTLWKTVWTDFDFALPGGESSRQAQLRVHAAALQVVTTSRARTLAISSHGNAIGLLLQQIDPAFTFEHACSIRNPDILRMTFDGASLHWDSEFSLESLGVFATRVDTATLIAETGTGRDRQPRAPSSSGG